jgi:hypothetical protein
MNRAPDWTEEEFRALIENPKMAYDELAKVLPTRSVGAMTTVRSFLHSYHTGGDTSGLSEMMKRVLRERKHSVTCPQCGERF